MQSPEWILWNVLLALVPVGLAQCLAWVLAGRAPSRAVRWMLGIPLAVLWVLFLPNACYLLTEWRHFLFDPHFTAARDAGEASRQGLVHVARQALFFLAYSGFGMVCFALGIRPVHRAVGSRPALVVLGGAALFISQSLGVYLGLIRRLNSWDSLRRWQDVAGVAWHGLTTPTLLKAILVFAALLWAAYMVVTIWIDGLNVRLHRSRAT